MKMKMIPVTEQGAPVTLKEKLQQRCAQVVENHTLWASCRGLGSQGPIMPARAYCRAIKGDLTVVGTPLCPDLTRWEVFDFEVVAWILVLVYTGGWREKTDAGVPEWYTMF